MGESHIDARDREPRGKVHILEIGPGPESLAVEFYRRFDNPHVVFIAAEHDPKFSSPVSDNDVIVGDIMDYVGSHDPSIPSAGFDYVVAQNVFSAARGKLRDLYSLAQGLETIVRPGGMVIIEDQEFRRPATQQVIVKPFEKAGFIVSVSTDQARYIAPSLSVFRPFHMEAQKPLYRA